eukprot:755523-Hanusia_phi.AAC.2
MAKAICLLPLFVSAAICCGFAKGQQANRTVGVLSPVLVKTYGSVPLLSFKQVSMACLIALLHVNTRDPQIVGQAVVDSLPKGFYVQVKFKDSQFDAAEALKGVLAWRETNTIDSIVGPMTSDASQVVSLVSALQEIPVMSFGATSTLLSDKLTYPLFSRTNPLISLNAMALIGVCVRFEWKNIAVLCADTTYGNGFLSNIQEQGTTKNIHFIQVQKFVPENAQSIAAAMNSLRRSGAKVFLYIGIGVVNLEDVLASAESEGLLQDGYAWVAGEIGVPSAVVQSMKRKELAQLLKGWIQIRVAPLYGEKRVLLETAFKTVDQAKVNNSVIGMQPAEFSMPVPDYAAFAYDAAWATALGLAKTSKGGKELADAIRSTSFRGASGSVSFDQSGNRQASGITVTVENIQPFPANESVLISDVIGVWEATQGFADVRHQTPLWPGGRIGWKPPSDGSGQGRDTLLMIVLVVSGVFLVLLLTISALFYRLYKASLRNRTAEETDLSNMIARVREVLGVTKSDGYILPSEKVTQIFSFCSGRSHFIILERRCIEAVAKLALGDDFAKDDFERFYNFVKYRTAVVSGMALGVKEEQARSFIDLSDIEAQEGTEERNEVMQRLQTLILLVCLRLLSLSTANAGEGESGNGTMRRGSRTLQSQASLQDLTHLDKTYGLYEDKTFTRYVSEDFERAYEYFTGRVLRLNAWRDNALLLPRLKKHIQQLMDRLGRINDRRYESIVKEEGGEQLKGLGKEFEQCLFYQDDEMVPF